jgi:hypothetical protein
MTRTRKREKTMKKPILLVLTLLSAIPAAEAADYQCRKAALRFARAIRKVDAPKEDARASYSLMNSQYDEDSGVEVHIVVRKVRDGEDEGPWSNIRLMLYGEGERCRLVGADVPGVG